MAHPIVLARPPNRFVSHTIFLLSYADWCGACKRFSSEIDKVLPALQIAGVSFGTVNFDKNIRLSSRFLVVRLPTLFYVENGTVVKQVRG